MFESGAQKSRLQGEKEIRDKELLKKIPKLTGFFKRANERKSQHPRVAVVRREPAGMQETEPR